MLEKVISIISEYQDIPADTIHAESHLVNDLGFTSYDVVSLVGKFEDEFDIEVPALLSLSSRGFLVPLHFLP